MPDSKKTDLTRTSTEQESGIVDPYAESIRKAIAQRAESAVSDQEIQEIATLGQADD